MPANGQPLEEEPNSALPPEPQLLLLDEQWEHAALYHRVYKALFALPSLFKSNLTISGVMATDLFAFNASLGATIEAQVTSALNAIRSTWDPKEEYTLYQFVRQPQTFPDVTLRTNAPGQSPTVIMGIELKGLFLLAKEREPSFRYRVTPAVCTPADLLVVYPWALSNVISGTSQLFTPYIVNARYAAEYRNWWWQYRKGGNGNNQVKLSSEHTYYPMKSDRTSDVAPGDNGGNFGRFARTGLMESYIASIFREELAGIPLDAWQRFLTIFTEGRSEERMERVLNVLAKDYTQRQAQFSIEVIAKIQYLIDELVGLLQEN